MFGKFETDIFLFLGREIPAMVDMFGVGTRNDMFFFIRSIH